MCPRSKSSQLPYRMIWRVKNGLVTVLLLIKCQKIFVTKGVCAFFAEMAEGFKLMKILQCRRTVSWFVAVLLLTLQMVTATDFHFIVAGKASVYSRLDVSRHDMD